jgi:hypothetical protein
MQTQSRLPAIHRSISRQLATVGLFSAIYAVFRYIPTFPMYGLSGTSFRAGDFLAPLLGMLLGPWLAIPCIIIGTTINYALTPPIFLGLDFLPATVSALVAGLISTGRTKSAIGLYAGLLALFLVLPLSTFWISIPGGFQVPFAWLHILGFIGLISPLGLKAYKWSKAPAGFTFVLGVLIMVLSATLAQHLTGGILEELILFPTFKITTPAKAALFWTFIFDVYPIERIIITAVTTFFGVAALRAVKTSGLEQILSQLRRPNSPATTPK